MAALGATRRALRERSSGERHTDGCASFRPCCIAALPQLQSLRAHLARLQTPHLASALCALLLTLRFFVGHIEPRLAALGVMIYALVIYQLRAKAIRTRTSQPYDDRLGPVRSRGGR